MVVFVFQPEVYYLRSHNVVICSIVFFSWERLQPRVPYPCFQTPFQSPAVCCSLPPLTASCVKPTKITPEMTSFASKVQVWHLDGTVAVLPICLVGEFFFTVYAVCNYYYCD